MISYEMTPEATQTENEESEAQKALAEKPQLQKLQTIKLMLTARQTLLPITRQKLKHQAS